MITKELLENFKEDFKQQMKALEEKYGVSVLLGRITYSSKSFTSSFQVFAKEGNESLSAVEIRYKEEYFKNYYKYGLEKEYYGKTIVLDGRKFKVVSCKCAGCRNPLVVKDEEGKYFRIPLNFEVCLALEQGAENEESI